MCLWSPLEGLLELQLPSVGSLVTEILPQVFDIHHPIINSLTKCGISNFSSELINSLISSKNRNGLSGAYPTSPSFTGQTLISIYLLFTNWRLYVERSQNLSTQALQCGVVGKRLLDWHFVLSCENYYRLYFRCERFRTALIESHIRMFSLNFSGKHSTLLIINHTSGPLYYRSKLHSTYSEPPVV